MVVSSALSMLLVAQVSVVPAGPPCFPRHVIDQHIAYFSTGSAELDLKSAWRVKTAADYIEAGVSTVTVYGRTDTAGSEASNLDLSRRRAETVADELVRLGVPEETITLVPQGEAALSRQTADDTPETLNRMVLIEFEGGSIPALAKPKEVYCPMGR